MNAEDRRDCDWTVMRPLEAWPDTNSQGHQVIANRLRTRYKDAARPFHLCLALASTVCSHSCYAARFPVMRYWVTRLPKDVYVMSRGRTWTMEQQPEGGGRQRPPTPSPEEAAPDARRSRERFRGVACPAERPADEDKTRDQLLAEVRELRRQLASQQATRAEDEAERPSATLTNAEEPTTVVTLATSWANRWGGRAIWRPPPPTEGVARRRSDMNLRRQFAFLRAITDGPRRGGAGGRSCGPAQLPNPACQAMIGWTHAELLESRSMPSCTRLEVARLRADASDCLFCASLGMAEQTTAAETCFVRTDGATFPCEYVTAPDVAR